jgi:hypothetical protein
MKCECRGYNTSGKRYIRKGTGNCNNCIIDLEPIETDDIVSTKDRIGVRA